MMTRLKKNKEQYIKNKDNEKNGKMWKNITYG